MNNRKVVITGLGMATALGLGVEENWQKALSGISGISRLTYQGAEHSKVQAVGQIRSTDWKKIQEEFPEDAMIEGARRTLFGMWAAQQALKDAGIVTCESESQNPPFPPFAKGRNTPLTPLDRGEFSDNNRCGIVMAAGLGINRPEDVHRWIKKDGNFDYDRFGREYKEIHRESLVKNNSNRPSALIAKHQKPDAFQGFSPTFQKIFFERDFFDSFNGVR